MKPEEKNPREAGRVIVRKLLNNWSELPDLFTSLRGIRNLGGRGDDLWLLGEQVDIQQIVYSLDWPVHQDLDQLYKKLEGVGATLVDQGIMHYGPDEKRELLAAIERCKANVAELQRLVSEVAEVAKVADEAFIDRILKTNEDSDAPFMTSDELKRLWELACPRVKKEVQNQEGVKKIIFQSLANIGPLLTNGRNTRAFSVELKAKIQSHINKVIQLAGKNSGTGVKLLGVLKLQMDAGCAEQEEKIAAEERPRVDDREKPGRNCFWRCIFWGKSHPDGSFLPGAGAPVKRNVSFL